LQEIEEYKDGVASTDVTVTPSFIKFHQLIQNLLRRGQQAHGHDTISLSFHINKERKLKILQKFKLLGSRTK
jgi:hypothetical protein